MSDRKWIGVDLDGTLAEYDTWRGHEHIGAPIPKMVERVKAWLADGQEVRIFTARMHGLWIGCDVVTPIQRWCEEHIGQRLPVTNVKDFAMSELWDDRCVQVVRNTGAAVGDSSERPTAMDFIRQTRAYLASVEKDDDRRQLFNELMLGYCRHCGRDDSGTRGCQCWNDD